MKTKEKKPCAHCIDSIRFVKSRHLKKYVYPSSRQFLPLDQRKRNSTREVLDCFDGQPIRDASSGKHLLGEFWLKHWKKEGTDLSYVKCINKFFIHFDLLYWKLCLYFDIISLFILTLICFYLNQLEVISICKGYSYFMA